jgi:zinc/manganese transport system permease protein
MATIMVTLTTPERIPTMFEYEFMQNAFAASGIVAVLAGVVGYFLVLRGQTFAGHALSHVGFTGATGAVLVGMSPLWGMIGFTLAAGIGMGALGEKLTGRDVAIGVILTLSLGFRPAVSAFLHRVRQPGDCAAVRQCARREP